MHSLDFELYADAAASEIRDGALREAVREELLSHMEEKADDLVSWGAPSKDAVLESLRDMGDTEPVSSLLGAIHSHLPRIRLRNAMDKISVGLFLLFFSIDIWHIGFFTNTIGTLLLFSGILQLRRANRKLRFAFILMSISAAIKAAVGIFLALPASATLPDTLWINLPCAALLFYCLHHLFSGLADLAGLDTNGRRHSVSGCGFAYFAIMVLAMFGDSLGLIGLIIASVIFIFILVQVRSLRNLIWKQGKGFGVKSVTLLGRILFISIAVLLFASAPVTSYLAATGTPEASLYNIHDSGENAGDIRANLLFLGMDEALLSDLPDSEVLKLSDTQKVYMSYSHFSVNDRDADWLNVTSALCEAGGRRPSRLVFSAAWDKTPSKTFRDGIFPLCQQEYVTSYGQYANDPWAICLFERVGKTFSMPALSELNKEQPITSRGDNLPGAEFRLMPDVTRQRVLYIINCDVNSVKAANSHIALVYIHRTQWFISPFQSSAPYQAADALAYSSRPGFEQYRASLRFESDT